MSRLLAHFSSLRLPKNYNNSAYQPVIHQLSMTRVTATVSVGSHCYLKVLLDTYGALAVSVLQQAKPISEKCIQDVPQDLCGIQHRKWQLAHLTTRCFTFISFICRSSSQTYSHGSLLQWHFHTKFWNPQMDVSRKRHYGEDFFSKSTTNYKTSNFKALGYRKSINNLKIVQRELEQIQTDSLQIKE